MPDTVIKVENLSKKYILSHQCQEKYTALRDVMARGVKNLGKRLLAPFTSSTFPQFNDSTEEFYALHDVSFEIKQGDRVGIIGRNGAGKSTLLKILSRITEPTSGRIEITGRVASLLEVGTGFHPELTGRENIFLNGAILGMGKTEIKRKFDEIVNFAEVERFLDTPVKRYSSGMYVRLAFAVAAHLEPEILIVDEVLAVGDAQFQKKCLGKLGNVAVEGKTIIVVSHQMTIINNLCNSCLLLDKGGIVTSGNPNEVIPYYLYENEKRRRCTSATQRFKASPYLTIEKFYLADNDGAISQCFSHGDSGFIVIEGTIDHYDDRLGVGVSIYDELGNNLFISFHTDQPHEKWPITTAGPFRIQGKLDFGYLNEGHYRLDLFCTIHCVEMIINGEVTIPFEVFGNSSGSPYWTSRRNTLIAPSIEWKSIE